MAVDRGSLVRGIDFCSLEDAFSACQYPITSEQLATCLREETIGHGGSRTRIGAALDELDGIFDSPREVRSALRDELETSQDPLGHRRPPAHQEKSREQTDRARRPPFNRPGDI